MPQVPASRPAAARPASSPAARKVRVLARPRRQVDVALFHKLPGAGTPRVSAAEDAVLGKMGPEAFLLDKLERVGPRSAVAAQGFRLLTRVVGPVMYVATAAFQAKLLTKVMRDPTITPGSKAALAVGTTATAVGASASVAAAVPAPVAALVGLSRAGQVAAIKVAGVAGGLAGMIFNAINLRETLREPDGTPARRFFAKAAFAVGSVAFVASAVALVGSLAAGGAVPAFVALAAKIATALGLLGSLAWIGQLALGRNAWLNERLRGTWLG